MDCDDGAPWGCDCCGRDAEDCGMGEHGWVEDLEGLADGGTYCVSCAAALRLTHWSATCVRCERGIDDEAEAERTGWGYIVNPLGELHALCPDCIGVTIRPLRRRSDRL